MRHTDCAETAAEEFFFARASINIRLFTAHEKHWRFPFPDTPKNHDFFVE